MTWTPDSACFTNWQRSVLPSPIGTEIVAIGKSLHIFPHPASHFRHFGLRAAEIAADCTDCADKEDFPFLTRAIRTIRVWPNPAFPLPSAITYRLCPRRQVTVARPEPHGDFTVVPPLANGGTTACLRRGTRDSRVQGWRDRAPKARLFGAPNSVRTGRPDAGNGQRVNAGTAEG